MKYMAEYNRADTVFTKAWLPTVDSLADYFLRYGTANERLMACYLQGRVHHDMGEIPQALDCYQRAITQADTTRTDCDLHTLTAIYGQMADLFEAQYLPDNEIKALLMAEQIAWKHKDTLSAIKAYELRIRPFYLKKEKDSMLLVMQEARKRYLQIGHPKEAAQAIYSAISIFLDRQQIQKAKRYLDLYEKESGNFDKNGNLISGGYYYYDKGRYHLAVGQSDSACYYFHRALSRGQKEAAYHGLLSIYEKKNIPDSIAKYAKLYAAANDSCFMHVNQERVHQITAMYDYSHHQRLFAAEFKYSSENKRLLSKKYREIRPILNSLLNREVCNKQTAYIERTNAAFKDRIKKEHLKEEMFNNDIITSYIHMILNRYYNFAQRAHELVIYYSLYNYYKSAIMRFKNENKKNINILINL